jgi:hypothetical protein
VSYLPKRIVDFVMSHRDAASSTLLAVASESPEPLKVGEIMAKTNLGERAVQKAAVFLVEAGFLVENNRRYSLAVVENPIQPVRKSEPQSERKFTSGASRGAYQKANGEAYQNTGKTGKDDAIDTKPDLTNRSQNQETQKTPVCVTPTQERTFNKDQQQVQEHTHKTNLELICDELAFAWQGTTDLTEVAASKLTKPGRDLERTGFSASDVVSIAKFIRARDTWRKGPITPVIIATEAPSWRASGGVVPSATPRRGHVASDEQWASEEAEYQAQIDREIAKAEAADAERERVK